jgi:hypothetical protein
MLKIWNKIQISFKNIYWRHKFGPLKKVVSNMKYLYKQNDIARL